MKIIVSGGGQETEDSAGEGNNSYLATEKSRFRRGGRNEQSAAVGKPSGFKIVVIFGDGCLLHFSGGGIYSEESADILRRRLNDGNHNGLAIGRPGKCEAIRLNLLVMKEVAFDSTIAPRDLKVGHRGLAMLVQE